jgi:hypothetical protein
MPLTAPRLFRSLLLIPAVLIIGCATRQRPATNWQLRPLENGHILVPPRPPAGNFVVLEKARSVRNASPACDVAGSWIHLKWQGRSCRIEINPDALGPVGRVVLIGGAGPIDGEPLSDLTWWPRFIGELEQREKNGCLAPGEALRLSERIVENIAVPTRLGYDLRYGESGKTGYLDLEPQFALKAMAPLLNPGVRRYRGPKDARGYETAMYDLKPRGNRGVRIALQQVEHSIGGKLQMKGHPTAQQIRLPDSSPFVRYFFRSWRIGSDRKIALLAANRREALDILTKKFEADPERFCASVPASEASCITIPSEMILVPEVKVRANGKAAYAPVGGTVGDILHSAGVRLREGDAPRVTVLRPYDGMPLPIEHDPSRTEILRVVLKGGEDIRW